MSVEHGHTYVAAYPYGGHEPWSGSVTSAERAARDEIDGEASRRQRETLAALLDRGTRGLTWRELAERQGWHHGQASGVLSVLHKVGRVERLAQSRGRCRIYVHPMWVNGRDVEPQGRTGGSRCPHCGGPL
jgi:hypothetical protein